MAAKPQAPAPKTPATEQPAVDITPLIAAFAVGTEAFKAAENAKDESQMALIVTGIEAREENPELTREDLRLALQTALADTYGLALDKVQKCPDKTLQTGTPKQREEYTARITPYTLVSTLLSIMWPTGEGSEKRQAAVKKAIAAGEPIYKLKARAAKPQAGKGGQDPDKDKADVSRLPGHIRALYTKAQTDCPADTDILAIFREVLDAIEAEEVAKATGAQG